MTQLLSIDRVKFQCTCGEWNSLYRLYFCRHCSKLKCSYCTSQEVDSMFCPSCLDVVSSGEARQRRNRCSNCYQCPICGVNVVLRSANNNYHLSCNTCRWTTSDSDVPDLSSSTGWPEYSNENEDFLNCVLEQMKSLATAEKTDRERHKYTKRRSNIGVVFSDRFGLQTMYNKRKAALTELLPTETVKVASTESVPDLDISVLKNDSSDTSILPMLMRQVSQPLANGRILLPVKTPLVGRHGVRCKKCDHSLCKTEYNPNSIKFKIQVLAINYVPDIRLSRPALLIPDQLCPLFLTISNFSPTSTRIIITPEMKDDPHFVKCDVPPLELSLSNRDETFEMEENHKKVGEPRGFIVFRKRHRIGIRLSVMASDISPVYLGLSVKYLNSSCSFDPNGVHEWLQNSVQILLKELPENASSEAASAGIETN